MSAPLFAPLPPGLPTYTGRHALRQRPRSLGPVSLVMDDFDLLWLRRGKLAVELQGFGELVGARDTFLLLPPFVPLTFRPRSAGGQTFWYCHFGFRGTAVDALRGPRERLLPLRFPARGAPEVARAYGRLNDELRKPPARPWRLESLLIEMVSELVAFAERVRPPESARVLERPGPRDRRVAEVCRRIAADPARSWKVDALARSMDLSTSHMHSLCRRQLGMSLQTYIQEIRMRRALVLLAERRDGRTPTVLEVSRACGYASQHHFSSRFKKRFGVSPSAYRVGQEVDC
jgi:AraC-like DNA-binding protein